MNKNKQIVDKFLKINYLKQQTEIFIIIFFNYIQSRAIKYISHKIYDDETGNKAASSLRTDIRIPQNVIQVTDT